MVEQGGKVTQPQWDAMRGVLGGAMPTWVDARSRDKEAGTRARVAANLTRAMLQRLEERLQEHRLKAAPAAKWIKEREDRRGLMRGVFGAWAAARGSSNVPNAHLSAADWKRMRERETAAQREERRLGEAVARIKSFAQCCYNNFWARREKTKRMLRLRLAMLRKARAIVGWSRFRGVVSRIMWRTRTRCALARREKRVAVVMADVVQLMRQDAAARQRAQRERTAGNRRARLNLLHAAMVRPVLTAMYLDAHPRGDG